MVSTIRDASLFAQGSGKMLAFDGSNDYVNITGTQANNCSTPANFTIEAWVQPSSLAIGTHTVFQFGTWTNDNVGIVFGLSGASVYAHIWNGTTSVFRPVTSGIVMNTTEMQHIAVTKNGNTMSLYRNGVLLTSDNTVTNYTSTTSLNWNIGNEWQNNADRSHYYAGKMDEVRVWGVARTLAEIRSTMCEKLSGAEANLIGYWRFDNGTGTAATDLSSSARTSTLTNFALSGSSSNWATSSAPIGDVSTSVYPGSWIGQSLSLTATARGTLTIGLVTGAPAGVHIYVVNSAPNSSSETTAALGSSNKYFGTFISNGTLPTYSAVLDYSGYADALQQEAALTFYDRASNADASWSNMLSLQSLEFHTMTSLLILGRREYVLGGSSAALPVELLYFNAHPVDEGVMITWATASESNSDRFHVLRSRDMTIWEEVADMNAAGNSEHVLQYATVDEGQRPGVVYYRLEQIDLDRTLHGYDPIAVNVAPHAEQDIIVFPNPTSGRTTVQMSTYMGTQNLVLRDALGRALSSSSTAPAGARRELDLSDLPAGIYYLCSQNGSTRIQKL